MSRIRHHCHSHLNAMKFGKLLKDQISEVPNELKPKFLSYKELKKQLKGISPGTPANTEDGTAGAGAGKGPAEAGAGDGAAAMASDRVGVSESDLPAPDQREGGNDGRLTPQEAGFVSKLNLEIIKFNDYFIKREEELIIRVKDLSDRLKAASGSSERVAMKSASVHLHGEIVLLLHWCELNYIGLVKILKKHDKKTGLLLRSPFLANVVKQPFCSTTILKRLVKQVEETILEEEDGGAQGGGEGETRGGGGSMEIEEPATLPQLVGEYSLDSDDEVEGCGAEDGGILKQTKVAINLWRELQKSKTPGGQGERRVSVDDNDNNEPAPKRAKS